MINKNLTIVSVSYNNKQHLQLNYELTKHLNSCSHNINWIITENSPPTSDLFSIADEKFKVLMGDEQECIPIWHHTLALKQALKRVETRFVLVLDPDFYIVMSEWVNQVIDYMVINDLSILGVPWHPKHIDKYRYFAAVHCCFFDTESFILKILILLLMILMGIMILFGLKNMLMKKSIFIQIL